MCTVHCALCIVTLWFALSISANLKYVQHGSNKIWEYFSKLWKIKLKTVNNEMTADKDLEIQVTAQSQDKFWQKCTLHINIYIYIFAYMHDIYMQWLLFLLLHIWNAFTLGHLRKDFDKLSSNLERIDVINLWVREENAEREEFVNKSVLQKNIKNQMPKCGAVANLKWVQFLTGRDELWSIF